MTQQKIVGIWIRVSTEFQVEAESPEYHERRARMYAESKEWQVFTVYRLEAVSGKAVIGHSEAKRMITDIKTKAITGLIFSKLARLARSTKELLEFAEIFREAGADLISLSESIDTSSAAGRLFYTMIAALSEWERHEIIDRVAASVPIRAKMGKSLGGQASYGYSWEENVLVVNQTEAPIRKLVYELFLEIRRKRSVAKVLNERGYRTRNGSKWSDNTIERLLRDSTAKGYHRANYTKSRGEGKGWNLKPEKDWIVTPCPAIVSVELWNQCNAILDEQLKPRKRQGKKSEYLLSGFVFCVCGNKMYVFRNSYLCRDCKRRILVTDVDEIYQQQLQSYLTQTSVTQYQEQSAEDIRDKELLLKQAKQEHSSLFKKAQEMLELRLGGELSKELFVPLYKPMEERLLQLEQYVPTLEAEVDFLKINLLSSEAVIEEANTLYDKWQTVSFEQKRGIIEVITDAVIVEDQEITIALASLRPQAAFSQNTLNKRPTSMDSCSRLT